MNRSAFANNSANDRPQIGCIGVGSMGTGDAQGHANFGDIVAVCDVDSRHAERARNDEKIGKGKADAYGDYRKVLERDDIDVVSVVTPDHWHVKIAIEALQAGKHVFCQKPLTLTLEENQLIRNACKKYNERVFLVGTQQRSDRNCFCGRSTWCRRACWATFRRSPSALTAVPTGGPFPTVEPPAELDWDMWLGQAPKVDYIEKRCHYEFRWWYEYSGGKFTDWGAHHVDIATWAIGADKQGMGPIEIDGTDAKHPVPYKDGYPTVDDCYNTSHDFAVKCTFAERHRDDGRQPQRQRHPVRGHEGPHLRQPRQDHRAQPIEENWDEGKFGDEDSRGCTKGKPHEGHKDNFYRCIREGGLPVSDVFTHVQAMNTCHLCAIAARLGSVIKWDPKAEKIVGDEQAAGLFGREQRTGFEIPVV